MVNNLFIFICWFACFCFTANCRGEKFSEQGPLSLSLIRVYTLASGIQGFKTLAAGMLQKKIIIPKFLQLFETCLLLETGLG